MLSVIVDARTPDRRLPALLAQLTAGALDGLVREVLIAAPPGAGIAVICEETGAVRCDSLGDAAAQARADHVLALPAGFRLRDGWVGSISDFMAGGGRSALVGGFGGDGILAALKAQPFGVLIARAAAARLEGADLDRLRRELGLRPARVG